MWAQLQTPPSLALNEASQLALQLKFIANAVTCSLRSKFN